MGTLPSFQSTFPSAGKARGCQLLTIFSRATINSNFYIKTHSFKNVQEKFRFFYKPQDQLKKMHLWARFGLLATNWRLARIPDALDRDSKTSTWKGLLSSPACRYILAVSCQPLFIDGGQMMVFPKVQKHSSCLKTD